MNNKNILPLHGGEYDTNSIKLDYSVNLNPLGLPKVISTALKDSLYDASIYPSLHQDRLKELLSKANNLPQDYFFIGNGASEAITLLAEALSSKCSKALIVDPTFSGYERALRARNYEIFSFSLTEDNDFELTSDILDHIKSIENLDLVFACSPNNPTGRAISFDLVKEMADTCKKLGIILVIDESFMGFDKDKKACSCLSLIEKYDNLVLIDAFTKLFAVPGVRLGYCISSNSKLIHKINELKPEWNVSSIAEATGIAILSENRPETEEYIEQTLELIEKEKAFLTNELIKIGFKVFKSDAPFLLFKLPPKLQKDGLSFYKKTAKDHGILLRNCSNFHGLDESYYRIAIKKHEDNIALIKALQLVSSYCDQDTTQ